VLDRLKTTARTLGAYSITAAIIAGLALAVWPPARPARGLAATAQQGRRAEITTPEHTLTILRPDVDLPAGHELFGIHWRTGTLSVALFENDQAAVATGPPGQYSGEFGASHARVKPDADGDKVLVFPPASVTQTWLVTISGETRPNPPPKDPANPRPGEPATAIIYDANAGTPVAGEGAALELRNQGQTAYFISAGTVTGDGGAPAFLSAAIDAAEKVGLPALVILNGRQVASAAPLPETKAAILQAVQAAQN